MKKEAMLMSKTRGLGLNMACRLPEQKVYYSLKNQLMTEHQNIIDAPNSFEIPEEINTIEQMNSYAKENGGILFYPTNSIADLKNDLHVNQEAILANCNTAMFLSRNGKLPCPDAFTNTNYNKDFLKYPETYCGEDTKKEAV